jgi:hypothetical protein
MGRAGGKRPGAGRKHRLTPAQREEVAREYHDRMTAYAAAQAYVRDPNTINRREIYKQMRDMAKTHKAMPGDGKDLLPEEDVIWAHPRIRPKIDKLKAKHDGIPNEPVATPRRAKGKAVRDSFLQELAEKWNISTRTVDRLHKAYRRRLLIERAKLVIEKYLIVAYNRK